MVQEGIGALWCMRRLIWDLTLRDLKANYIGSAGGWFWVIAKPGLMALAYFFVFAIVFKARLGLETGTQSFGVFLLVGLMPWIAFAEGLSRGTYCLIEAGPLLTKTALPVEVFPAKSVLVPWLIYVPVIVLVALGRMLAGSAHWGMLILPVWLLAQLLITYYLALALALMTAALRDVGQLVTLAMSVAIFVAPVFYPPAAIPETFRVIMWLNPATPLILGYHSLLLYAQLPDLKAIGATGLWMLLFAGFSRVLLKRSREQVVDWL
jgi:lipopolysaccharide transport system permease protein